MINFLNSNFFLELLQSLSLFFNLLITLFIIRAIYVFFSIKNHGEGRDTMLDILKQQTWQNSYKNLLGRLLNSLQTWIGDQPQAKFSSYLNVQAFEFNLKLAVVYPLFSLLLFWGVSNNSGAFAGLNLLPTDWPWYLR